MPKETENLVVDESWKEDISYIRSYFEKLESKEVDSAEKSTTDVETFTEILSEIKVVSIASQNLSQYGICVLVGLGLIVGVLFSLIVSRYFKH